MAVALLDASLLGFLAVVTVTDLRTRLIPDAAIACALLVGVLVIGMAEPAALPSRLLAGAAAAGFLLAAALIRPDGMGLGDVKLAGVLGLYLGGAVIVAVAVAFVAGSVTGLALIARHGWRARSRTIPFAPFLSLGALAVLAAQP